MKRGIMLYVDTELIEAGKARGMNMSKMFSEVLSDILKLDIEKETQASVDQEIESLKNKIVTLSQKKKAIKKGEEIIKREKYDDMLRKAGVHVD